MAHKLYCTIDYERGRPRGKGYVARFMRVSDSVYVGSATWSRKERRFEDLNKVTPEQVAPFAKLVPELRADGGQWSSR